MEQYPGQPAKAIEPIYKKKKNLGPTVQDSIIPKASVMQQFYASEVATPLNTMKTQQSTVLIYLLRCIQHAQ